MIKRTLTAAAATLALGSGLLAAGTAQASAAGRPSPAAQLHKLERAIVDWQTFGIGGQTYRALEVPPLSGAWPADVRLCHAVARFNAAGVPGDGMVRRIARDTLHASPSYRYAAGDLVAAITAGGPFASQDHTMVRYCTDRPRG